MDRPAPVDPSTAVGRTMAGGSSQPDPGRLRTRPAGTSPALQDAGTQDPVELCCSHSGGSTTSRSPPDCVRRRAPCASGTATTRWYALVTSPSDAPTGLPRRLLKRRAVSDAVVLAAFAAALFSTAAFVWMLCRATAGTCAAGASDLDQPTAECVADSSPTPAIEHPAASTALSAEAPPQARSAQGDTPASNDGLSGSATAPPRPPPNAPSRHAHRPAPRRQQQDSRPPHGPPAGTAPMALHSVDPPVVPEPTARSPKIQTW